MRIVQLLDPRLDRLQHLGRILAFAHEDDAGDDFVVIVHPYRALPRNRADIDGGNIADQQGRPAVLSQNDVADVVGGAQQADAADQILLIALLQVTAARVRISLPQRREDLLHGNVVGLKLGQIQTDLVLFQKSAQADHVGHAGRQLQVARDRPILDRAQLPQVLPVAGHAIAKQLADGCGQRRQLHLGLAGKVHVAEAFEHQLASLIIVGAVVEGDDQERQAELRVRKHAHRVRQSAQADLQRRGDLLFDFLGRVSRIEGDDGDLDIGNIRKRLDRQILERHDAAQQKQAGQQEHEQRLMQRKRD